MRQTFALVLLIFLVPLSLYSQSVYILADKGSPQVEYAKGKLIPALTKKGYKIVPDAKSYDYLINLGVDESRLQAEAFMIKKEAKMISVLGGDNRGMIYGALSMMESLNQGGNLDDVRYQLEKPYYPLRAIKHNTSWYSYRPSSALDQHTETLKDPKYWEAFMDMMVENRFNSLSIWNLHPFVFMIKTSRKLAHSRMQKWRSGKSCIRQFSKWLLNVRWIPISFRSTSL
jgi:hypothetical protein